MLIEIRTRFQHFMSVCYTVINMTDDWIHDWTTDPYPCKFWIDVSHSCQFCSFQLWLAHCLFIHVSMFILTEMMWDQEEEVARPQQLEVLWVWMWDRRQCLEPLGWSLWYLCIFAEYRSSALRRLYRLYVTMYRTYTSSFWLYSSAQSHVFWSLGPCIFHSESCDNFRASF